MKELYRYLFEAHNNYASKEEIISYLRKNNIHEVIDHLYDQTRTDIVPTNMKFMFKSRKDQANWLQVVSSGISHNEFIDLISRYGFKVEDSSNTKTYIIYNDDIRIKCHESGWNKTKGNTDYLTEFREMASIIAIQNHYSDNSMLNKLSEEFTEWANKKFPKMMSDISVISLIPSYLASGIKASAIFYESFPTINPYEYEYERRDVQAKRIYKKAIELGAGKADNWNPADVWMIKKDFNVKEFLSQFNNGDATLLMFNAAIKQQLDALNLIPISLKLITGENQGKCEIINPVSVEDMMSNYDAQISNIVFGFTRESDCVGSMHIYLSVHLNNDYVINVWDKSNSFSSTYELRVTKGAHHAEGGVDKDYVINHYIFHDEDIKKLQKRFENNKNDNNIRDMEAYVDDIADMARQRGIKLYYEKGTEISIPQLKRMYKHDDPKVIGRYVMTILNLYYILKNADKKAINMMYLAGLKRAHNQCSYLKIH